MELSDKALASKSKNKEQCSGTKKSHNTEFDQDN